MAVISPPAYLQSGSHSAQGDRQVVSALAGQDIETFTNGVDAVGVGHGLVRTGHLAVSEKSGTPNMSVDVAAGIALVTGSSSLAQGVYVFSNDAVVNLAIATADATNPRYDLVIAQVRDNTEDSGGSNDARLAVVTGTPAVSPADPTVPDGCLVLARVEVDALASSIVNADITVLAGLARGSNWNQAWGVVGTPAAAGGSNQTGITTIADITGLSVAFTAVAGRRYKATLNLTTSQSATGGNQSIYLMTDLGTFRVRSWAAPSSTAALSWSLAEQFITTAGARTVKAQAAVDTGSLTIQNDFTRNATLLVEDIGPQ